MIAFLEAWRAVGRRLTRTLLSALGVAIGVCAGVASLSVSASAGNAMSARFDALASTLVVVSPPLREGATMADDWRERATRLPGVESVGRLVTASENTRVIRVGEDPNTEHDIRLLAADTTTFGILDARLRWGRTFDAVASDHRLPVAVVDTAAANRLGKPGLGQLLSINGQTFVLIGIIESSEDRLTNAVVLPMWTVESDVLGSSRAPQLLVRTQLGWGATVGDSLPLAVSPEDPEGPIAMIPPSLDSLRNGIDSDSRSLYLGLALVSVLVGVLGIRNTTQVAVLERRREIGLRRSVGATRESIALQFLVESAVTGLIGGAAGALIGLDLTVVICLVKGWVPVLAPIVPAVAVLTGLLAGALAGLGPALKASAIDPADALRAS